MGLLEPSDFLLRNIGDRNPESLGHFSAALQFNILLISAVICSEVLMSKFSQRNVLIGGGRTNGILYPESIDRMGSGAPKDFHACK